MYLISGEDYHYNLDLVDILKNTCSIPIVSAFYLKTKTSVHSIYCKNYNAILNTMTNYSEIAEAITDCFPVELQMLFKLNGISLEVMAGRVYVVDNSGYFLNTDDLLNLFPVDIVKKIMVILQDVCDCYYTGFYYEEKSLYEDMLKIIEAKYTYNTDFDD
jgi:hypothetical protein